MNISPKTIKDIRLFSLTVPNIDVAPLPNYISNISAIRFASRLALKLWENSVELGNFTHLYIDYNFSMDKGEKCFSLRSVDKNNPWYRFYEYGGSGINLDNVDLRFFADSIKDIFLSEYPSISSEVEKIIEYVYRNGENTKILYKQKTDGKNTVKIILQVLDNGKLLPTVKIQQEEKVIACKKLPVTVDTGAFGSINISKHKVIIKSKTAKIYQNIKPTEIEY